MIPLEGYKTEINLNMLIARLSNGKVTIRDNGFEDDVYKCKFTLVVNETDAQYISDIVQNTGRGEPVSLAVLLGESTPNFYPFGPHVDMSASDLVNIVKWVDKGQVDPFGTYFEFEVEITPAFSVVYNNTVTDCGSGGFNFGSLINTYLPKFSPMIQYKINYMQTGRNTFLNHNSQSTQKQDTKLEWVDIITEGARNILLEVCRNVRSIAITINAGSNWRAYGYQGGQGDKSVKLTSTKIAIEHRTGNLWKLSLGVTDVD